MVIGEILIILLLIDDVQGVVLAKDVLHRHLDGKDLNMSALAREAPDVHKSAGTLHVLDLLKHLPARLALVRDELAQLGEVPTAGQGFHWGGWRFEVVDMDGQRIDQVRVSPEPELP